MSVTETFVIVGGGLAGAKGAQALRERGFRGRIALIGDERHEPYERPPLSKEYLLGDAGFDSALARPSRWYADNGVDLLLGVRAERIDRARRQVVLSSGDPVDYDKLLLATGSQPRSLPVPGADATGVLHLRRIEDSDEIKRTLAEVDRLVVVGAGWIGLEVAAAARLAGVEVVVVETEELPLVRLLGTAMGRMFAELHRAHGVDFRFGSAVSEVTTSGGQVTGVRLTDGSAISTPAVLLAVGAEPDGVLAADAGLRVDNGVIADASLRTADPHIAVAGDVANAYHPRLHRQLRVEHWANALHQPAVAAASMLGGDLVYDRLPYFFTDQYDLGMEFLGHTGAGEFDQVVVRGDLPGREFIAFWLSEGRVRAGMNVNVWDVTDQIGALITSGAPIDPESLQDPSAPLEQLVPA
ncbi:FAD-dependent oxidoreductase [Saccharopolyspora sp. HNM0983]|uniref:FAD-dependent oxidoreductase n=1 Tax=Saccharopolyspora montiporae TaxID=2781240 RepID=A0A929BB58_9PSEU|nr:FAD-dependent oxidoreductase [Saccharopolyspora sp. HNM0983]